MTQDAIDAYEEEAARLEYQEELPRGVAEERARALVKVRYGVTIK